VQKTTPLNFCTPPEQIEEAKISCVKNPERFQNSQGFCLNIRPGKYEDIVWIVRMT